ncbi:pleckstrin homology domain-containing family A member 8 isoform X4 [Hydra vulgaris]|uniref:Pleckstrin homology domain-containing family A member 8 n=1 Tax=Hydra vulgaris TaxID=6087 RepID=A0ABM4C358_HYDVU
MVMMEGMLWKWTNYLSGWQPRWFILDYGVMSYYRSQDDVHLGSRGAVKMSCCEILINASDQLRIDLKIPPENFIYLKASTPAERQKWIVALGTAKACIISSNLEEEKQQTHSMTFLKDKMKELLLCRGIMLEQIGTIKASGHTIENKKIIEAVTLLSATCDTFASNLDDILEIVEDNLNLFSDYPISAPKLTKPSKESVNSYRSLRSSSSLSSYSGSLAESGSHSSKVSLVSTTCPKAQDSSSYFGPLSPNGSSFDVDTAHNNTLDDTDKNLNLTDSSVSSASSCTSSVKSDIPNALLKNAITTPESDQVFVVPLSIAGKSIFGKAPAKFEDVQIGHHGLIPTKSFLEACRCILPVFDKLGATTFAPVKMDIQGNIKKIDAKYNTDTAAFEFLQNIVFQEINSNEHNARNSATDALLWLKRALEFVCIFLAEVLHGESDLVAAAVIFFVCDWITTSLYVH